MSLFCRECGEPLRGSVFELSDHRCVFEQLLAFQVQCARIELESGLEKQVAAWEREPNMARHVAFARYVRDRQEAA